LGELPAFYSFVLVGWFARSKLKGLTGF
jgi:hypothetical protein